jgi:hypothetical protein
MEFIEPLREGGLTSTRSRAAQFALATGRLKDRVRDSAARDRRAARRRPRSRAAWSTKYAENLAWDGTVDAGRHRGVVAESNALYGLELLEPPPPEPTPPPPPPAEIVTRDDVDAVAR